MPQKFYYPTFIRKVQVLNNFLRRHQDQLISNNTITDPELTQLTNLRTATEAIAGTGSTWPQYRELP